MPVREAIEAQFRHYEEHGITDPNHHESDVKHATTRAMKRIALGTFSDELLQQVINEHSYAHDALHGEYEGKFYYTELVAKLAPDQLAQLIAYKALTPIKMLGTDKVFVLIYNETAKAFQVEEMPTADSIKPTLTQ